LYGGKGSERYFAFGAFGWDTCARRDGGGPERHRRSEWNEDAPDARANYDNWAKGIPKAKKVVFPNAAHLVNIDMPKEFNQTVLEFLSKL